MASNLTVHGKLIEEPAQTGREAENNVQDRFAGNHEATDDGRNQNDVQSCENDVTHSDLLV
jgi:hypothetical protein